MSFFFGGGLKIFFIKTTGSIGCKQKIYHIDNMESCIANLEVYQETFDWI